MNWQKDIRWLPVRNMSGETIPPFAVMRIRGMLTNSGLAIGSSLQLQERQIIYLVDKPNAYSEQTQRPEAHLFNGQDVIAKNGRGSGTMDYPGMALLEAYTAAELNDGLEVLVPTVGFEADSWLLHLGKTAYTLIDVKTDQEFFYSADGSYRAWVRPNLKPAAIGWHGTFSGTYDFSLSSKAIEIVGTSFGLPVFGEQDDDRGIQAAVGGLYLVAFSCDAAWETTESPASPREILVIKAVASAVEPTANNWGSEEECFSQWQPPYIDFDTPPGGYQLHSFGNLSSQMLVRLEAEDWIGMVGAAVDSMTGLEIQNGTLTVLKVAD